MDIKAYIRNVPDFPREGILFRDITPLLQHAGAFSHVLDLLEERATACTPAAIVGIESRGFLFGGPLADRMGLPFVPVRKPGKLPAARMSIEYTLEYGDSQLDIHQDALQPGERAYVVDDLLATGGTARAAAKLIELIGGVVCGMGFVVELEDLGGRRLIEEYETFSIVRF
ncbi:MAG TPA: adenine phosphoribosyltransferase [Tepidiformaceae bacterium]